MAGAKKLLTTTKFVKRITAICIALGLSVAAFGHSWSLPAWMTGAWAYQNGDDWGDEYWTPPRGNIMIGAARMGKGDELVVWESTRIAYDEDGKLAFWAMPRGATATKFPALESGDKDITFANATNDYPQRIRYWREGKALNAEISMMDGSKPYRFSYQALRQ